MVQNGETRFGKGRGLWEDNVVVFVRQEGIVPFEAEEAAWLNFFWSIVSKEFIAIFIPSKSSLLFGNRSAVLDGSQKIILKSMTKW